MSSTNLTKREMTKVLKSMLGVPVTISRSSPNGLCFYNCVAKLFDSEESSVDRLLQAYCSHLRRTPGLFEGIVQEALADGYHDDNFATIEVYLEHVANGDVWADEVAITAVAKHLDVTFLIANNIAEGQFYRVPRSAVLGEETRAAVLRLFIDEDGDGHYDNVGIGGEYLLSPPSDQIRRLFSN